MGAAAILVMFPRRGEQTCTPETLTLQVKFGFDWRSGF